ncbi:MAG: SDR family oxidoreductase [Acidimicrobiales bacterium]|nr:SDR family oxidoreductase [Acidimicrobiales bacterium]
MFDLGSRVAVVTGAGQGVGAGIARVLAAAGAAVAVNDLHDERAAEVVEQISSAGGTAVPAAFDVADRAAVNAAMARIESDLGPIDICVNNAGIPETMRPVKFLEMPEDEWDPYLDVNLKGVLHCCRAVVPGMVERGHGRVITISSGAGMVGLGIGVSLYAAGKGGAIAFMRHLAIETARKGVTCNTLALGLMAGKAPSDTTAAMARQVPVGRLGTPEDVGATCAFLASDEAAWLTGQTIHLNGGAVTS